MPLCLTANQEDRSEVEDPMAKEPPDQSPHSDEVPIVSAEDALAVIVLSSNKLQDSVLNCLVQLPDGTQVPMSDLVNLTDGPP